MTRAGSILDPAAEALARLRAIDEIAPRERFANMVARGVINANGVPTRAIGGKAKATAARVFTIEVDGTGVTTVRIVSHRGKKAVAVYGARVPASPEELGNDLESVLRRAFQKLPQKIAIHDSNAGGALAARVLRADAIGASWTWELSNGSKRSAPSSVFTLAGAFDDVFAVLAA